MTAVIAVTSGKPQSGKSFLSMNLAHYLNRKGYRTGVLVAGNEEPLWGVTPNTTWPNIIGGRLSVDHAIERNVYGIDLMVTRGHGHALGNLSTRTAEVWSDPLGILNSYAYLIVDMAAGVYSSAIACCLAATETIMVLTPETPTLTTGYEWLAKLSRHGFNGPVNLVLNQIRKPAKTHTVYMRFKDLAHERLKIQSNLWGAIPHENQINPSDVLRHPVADIVPQSRLNKEISTIGDRLIAEQPPENQTMPLSSFWQQFIQYLEKLPVIAYTPPPEKQRRQQPAQRGIGNKETLCQEAVDTVSTGNDGNQLHHICNQLDAIQEELSAIRKALESRPFPDECKTTESQSSEIKEMIIDFEDFASRQDNKGH